MTATQNTMKPSTVLHASEQPVYAPQDQAQTPPKSKLIHQIRGTAEPIIHFADDTGLVASVIKWDDGRLVLRLRGEESTIPEYKITPTSADP